MSVERWAERNDGLVTAEVARRSMSERQYLARRASGQLRAVRRGVNAIGGAPRTWDQTVRAAWLAAGPGIAIAQLTAARLLGAEVGRLDDGHVHLAGPMNRRVRLDGIRFHRSAIWQEDDLTRVRGMTVTSPLRTCIDISGSVTDAQLGSVIDSFLRRRIFTVDQLQERVDRTRPAAGRSVARLRRALSDRLPGYNAGESELEARIARLISRGFIKPPSQQHRIRIGAHRYRLDFAWPDERVYLEGNGFGWHWLGSDLDRDARRQNGLVLDGWRPIEITWRMTDREILGYLAAFGLAR